MKRMGKIAIVAVGMLSLSAMGVPNASAIITSWNYNAQAGFCTFAPGTVDAANPGSLPNPGPPCQANASPGPGPNLADRIEWGVSTGQGRSALVLTEPVLGVVNTNGGAAPDITITHQNKPITGFDPGALTNASILGSLTLTPLVPAGPALPAFVAPFNINFKETLNGGVCVDGSITTCDDIFVLLNPAALVVPFNPPTDPTTTYTLTLSITGLTPLGVNACSQAGVGPGCLGLLTPEGGDKAIQTNITITTSVVPEPSTLLLLGSGLAALSLYTRKRAKTHRVV